MGGRGETANFGRLDPTGAIPDGTGRRADAAVERPKRAHESASAPFEANEAPDEVIRALTALK